jgi:hypothetical protein
MSGYTYSKFLKSFYNNPILKNGCKELGENIYKYSNKKNNLITYSKFRDQYTILNLDKLDTHKELAQIQAYLHVHNNLINFVNVKNLNMNLQSTYNKIFNKETNILKGRSNTKV